MSASREGGQFLSIGHRNDQNGGVNVGGAVPERATELGLRHSMYVVKSDGVHVMNSRGATSLHDPREDFWNEDTYTDGVRVAFLATPSSGDGTRALEIIEGLRGHDIPTVTAEKAALAHHFPALEPYLGLMGISASVGGGTGMLPWLASKINPRTRQVHSVVNGTINHIVDGIDGGRTAGQVIDEAVTLGYAEPGATNHLEVINGELVGDIPKKASILWNTVLRNIFSPDTVLFPADLAQPALDQDGLNQLIAEAGARRYILSVVRSGEEIPEKDILAPLRREVDGGLVIIGGFRRISDNPLFKALRMPGPSNGSVITAGPNESDGVYKLEGPGAGPGPTAAAMVQDARQLLRAS